MNNASLMDTLPAVFSKKMALPSEFKKPILLILIFTQELKYSTALKPLSVMLPQLINFRPFKTSSFEFKKNKISGRLTVDHNLTW